MPSAETLLAFVATAVVFCLVPGPNVIYIVTRTLAEGRQAGLASVIGVWAAGIVHVALAAFGLSALLASSATAYDVVRYAGAAYLVVLGVRALLHRAPPEEVDPLRSPAPAAPRADARAAARQGFVVNLLSPKTALFFLALLPQFVHADAGSAAAQVLVLGGVLLLVGLLNDGLYAVAAGALATRLHERSGLIERSRRLSGVVYIGLGVSAALTGGRRTT